jgi:hypothetical protein
MHGQRDECRDDLPERPFVPVHSSPPSTALIVAQVVEGVDRIGRNSWKTLILLAVAQRDRAPEMRGQFT